MRLFAVCPWCAVFLLLCFYRCPYTGTVLVRYTESASPDPFRGRKSTNYARGPRRYLSSFRLSFETDCRYRRQYRRGYCPAKAPSNEQLPSATWERQPSDRQTLKFTYAPAGKSMTKKNDMESIFPRIFNLDESTPTTVNSSRTFSRNLMGYGSFL